MEGEGFNWGSEKEGHCLFIKIRHILRLSKIRVYIVPHTYIQVVTRSRQD